MPSIDFRKVRAEVTEFWSGEPVHDPMLVQRAVEHANGPDEPSWPSAGVVEPEDGIWDLHLPEYLISELKEREAREFEMSAADWYFRVRFLD